MVDDLISKANQDAKLICLYEIQGTEDQQPECLDEFSFAVGNRCIRGNHVKCVPIPIGKRVRELRHISIIKWLAENLSNVANVPKESRPCDVLRGRKVDTRCIWRGSQNKCRQAREMCHELAFFTLFSFLFYCIDTCCYSLESYSNTNIHSLPSISPSNFVSDHQRKSNSACIKSHDVANTTLKTTTDGPFQSTKTKRQDYLIVRQNDRTSNPL